MSVTVGRAFHYLLPSLNEPFPPRILPCYCPAHSILLVCSDSLFVLFCLPCSACHLIMATHTPAPAPIDSPEPSCVFARDSDQILELTLGKSGLVGMLWTLIAILAMDMILRVIVDYLNSE